MHCRRQKAAHGVRGRDRERNQHGAPVVRAGEDRARADRRAAVGPPRAHRRPGQVPDGGTAAGPGVPHQGAAGHRHLRGGDRGWRDVRFLLRGRGVRQLHRAARVLRDQRSGVRAAGPLELPHHAAQRDRGDLRRGGRDAAEAPPQMGDPVRWQGIQGRPLVRMGLDRDRLAAAPPADPPPHPHRRAGVPLLFHARGAAVHQDPADPRRRPALARRSRPPLLPVKRDLSFTAALLVRLPAFRRFLPGVVPSGRGCSSRAGGPCARGARASAARRR